MEFLEELKNVYQGNENIDDENDDVDDAIETENIDDNLQDDVEDFDSTDDEMESIGTVKSF